MNVDPLDDNLNRVSGKSFVFHLPQCLTIDGIGVIRAEFFHIKMFGTAADFLIRCNRDLDLAVYNLRMCPNT